MYVCYAVYTRAVAMHFVSMHLTMCIHMHMLYLYMRMLMQDPRAPSSPCGRVPSLQQRRCLA